MTRKLLAVIGIILCLAAAAVAQIVTPNGGGGGTGGGGSSGTINNAAQFSTSYYSAVGTTNTLSGVAFNGLQLDSTSGSPTAYGGVTCAANQFLTGLNASGAANSCLQPSFTNISGTATVPAGGTGLGTLPSNAILLGNGTSSVASVAPVAAGQVLVSGSPPSYSASPTLTALTTTTLTATNVTVSALTAGQCVQTGIGGVLTGTGSACGAGGGTGTISAGTVGNVPLYTASTTIGDTGVAWPPRLDQLGNPPQANYDMGNFFTTLQNGTYYLLGAPLVYGSSNEQLTGTTTPRAVNFNACPSENLGTSTISTVSSDAGGNFVTLGTPLSGIPDPGTALNDTTSKQITAIVTPTTGSNTTSKLYFTATTGFHVSDTVSTGTAVVCTTPTSTIAYQGVLIAGGLDQTGLTFTAPTGGIAAPFTPGTQSNKTIAAWMVPITAAPAATYTVSWVPAASGGFLIGNIANPNLGSPFENTTGFFGTTSSTSSQNFGGVNNTQTTDLFLTLSLQGTGNTQTVAGTPQQGKGIVEDVLYPGGVSAPAAACDNVDQNAFGYIPPYNNVMITDPQWGGTYQRMIRQGIGGNVDHNLYYTRMSWNSNHTLMLGIISPPGSGNPWILNLYDQNGCFLKPMFYLTGAPTNAPVFNWRINWSNTDPNIFYANGVSGKVAGIANINTNTLYAIHACATGITGSSDAACTVTSTYEVTPMYTFTTGNPVGANYISTVQPTGPSLDESGARIGIVTRPTSGTAGDYYWSSLPLTSSISVNPAGLQTYDISAGMPSGYCLSNGEVEKVRYIGNGELFQAAGYRGASTGGVCSGSAQDGAMQWLTDGSPTTQFGFVAQDLNAPWFNGGGHETYSPHIGAAPGGGYFGYLHVDGGTSFTLSSCTAAASVATCTIGGGLNAPKWTAGTNVIISGVTPNTYNGTFPISTNVGTQTNTFSYTLGSTPGAGSGGTVKDGNQWEIHTIGLNGTTDVTNAQMVNTLSGQTAHMFWPWGSPANGGTVTDFFYVGFAYNGITQYPVQTITGCTYTGTAPTGTATCTVSGTIPGNWTSPTQTPIGSLGVSTPYVSGVSDGSTQCYNIAAPITATTSNTFSYKPLCTPAGAGTGGTAYVGATDEIYKCYRGDATFGNGCVPIARTYSAQITSNFWFQPLVNGSQEGDLVEFDSAPGVVPVESFGKVTDALTAAPAASTPYNPSLFFTYAAISPSGMLNSTGSAAWAGATFAVQGGAAQAPVVTYTGSGDLSANGGQVVNVAPPAAPGSGLSEGNPVGAILPSTGVFTSVTDTGLVSGQCVQTTTGGLLATSGAACGSGTGSGPIFTHTVTEIAGAATMVVNSPSSPAIDTDYVALNGNATITTPATSAMADGQQVYLVATTSGTPWTVTFAAGAGVTLKSIVLGDSATGSAAGCGTIPSTGQAWYKFNYNSGNSTFVLNACGVNPPPATLATNVGGTGLAGPTAHSLMLTEGASPFNLLTAATAGNIAVDQGAGNDFALVTTSGDLGALAANGAAKVLNLHFGSANAVALPTTAPTSGGIPYFSSTSALASSAVLTASLPVLGGGAGAAPTSGSISGNTTKLATVTGSTTSGDYASWDASGNLTTQAGVNALPVNAEHSQTISGATNYSLQSAQVTNEVLTFSASATVTLPQATTAGQTLNAIVCQNGTGGFTPTFAATAGLTITGTFPTFTTTASKCGDFTLHYTTTTQAYLLGSHAGPL